MLIENIKEAFQNLLSNKMRSLLTMLGIIIGISAVITITTIGTSIKSTLNATLNSLGGNSISASVDAIYPEDDADWSNWEYPKMTADDYITTLMTVLIMPISEDILYVVTCHFSFFAYLSAKKL